MCGTCNARVSRQGWRDSLWGAVCSRRTRQRRGVAVSGRQALLAATNALWCSDLHVVSALGGGGRLHAGVETMAREIAVISGRVETHDLAEIRDVDYVSVYCIVSYVDTGAVSRTSLNCAPLSSSRRAGFPVPPARCVRSRRRTLRFTRERCKHAPTLEAPCRPQIGRAHV